MKVISVITARGGSKGIPRKNIIDVNGKPLLSYSIRASLQSCVDETWVSTEDEEIKNVALQYGAQVINRPMHLANDIIMPDAALLHAANNINFDVLVFIQPCAALIRPEYINAGIDMVIKGGYDSSFSAVKESWQPVWDINIKPVDWDIKNRPRRQEMPERYKETGMFYVTTKDALIKSKLRYSGKIGIVEIPLKDSFQVDNHQDLEMIRRIL